MKIEPIEIKDKLGRTIVLRNATPDDANDLIRYLEVISDNRNAIALYEKLGFKKYGSFPDNIKYANGQYASADWMMKKL